MSEVKGSFVVVSEVIDLAAHKPQMAPAPKFNTNTITLNGMIDVNKYIVESDSIKVHVISETKGVLTFVAIPK